MAGIGDSTLFPNSKMAAAAQLGQSRFRSGEITSVQPPSMAGAEATAFLARTSGLDTTHTNAYTALINGLVADGVWSKFDALYIFATQNSATSLLNLVSTNYNATVAGSPSFTVDRGYFSNVGGYYVDSTINPATTPGLKYKLNDAHGSCWSQTGGGGGVMLFGGSDGVSNSLGCQAAYPGGAGSNAYFYCNNFASGGGPTAVADSQGHYIANRSSNSILSGYKNGAQIYNNTSSSSTALFNTNVVFGNNCPLPFCMGSIGASLTSTDATNFYNRLRTYMTAVGVP